MDTLYVRENSQTHDIIKANPKLIKGIEIELLDQNRIARPLKFPSLSFMTHQNKKTLIVYESTEHYINIRYDTLKEWKERIDTQRKLEFLENL
jgi:hypothetical protein